MAFGVFENSCLASITIVDLSGKGIIKINIRLQTLEVGSNDRFAQELKNALKNKVPTNFRLQYCYFKFLSFCIEKGYLVVSSSSNVYNHNMVGKATPKLVL